MNQQQFQQQEDEPPRAQRMTEDEARAVIDLWQQERIESGGLTTRPAVQDVAEGLDIGVEDVQRLLQQVRTPRAAEEAKPAPEWNREESVQMRLAEEDRHLAGMRHQWAEVRRRQAHPPRRHEEQPRPDRRQAARSWSRTFGLHPPTSEEVTGTAQREAEIKAKDRRFSRYVLAILAAIAILTQLLLWLHH